MDEIHEIFNTTDVQLSGLIMCLKTDIHQGSLS